MEAASYKASDTPFKAARKMTMAEPNCQTRKSTITNNALLAPAIQLIFGPPKNVITVLISPSVLNTALQRMAMAMEPPRMDGI